MCKIFRTFNFRHLSYRRKIFNSENFPIYGTLSLSLSLTVLTEEQKQNVGMFIDPVTKFFEVQHH